MEIEIHCDPSSEQLQYWHYHHNLAQGQLHQLLKLETSMEDVDPAAAASAIEIMIRRHESLRTCFRMVDGAVRQCIVPYNKDRFSPVYYTVSEDENAEAVIREKIKECERLLQQVDTPPLFRCCIFKVPGNSYVLSLMIHHIISDGWSLEIMYREFGELYEAFKNGQVPAVPPLRLQLRDYTRIQKKWLTENLDTARDYWSGKLGPFLDHWRHEGSYETAPDRPKPMPEEELALILDKGKCASYLYRLDPDLHAKLTDLYMSCDASIWAVMTASLQLLFYHIAGKLDILIAMPAANRNIPGTEDMIGCLGGGIYLFQALDPGMSVKDLVRSNFIDFLESTQHIIFDHAEMRLTGPVYRLRCDVFANFSNDKIVGDREFHLAQDKVHAVSETPGYYALAFYVFEYRNGILFKWKYNMDLYPAEMIEYISEKHELLLHAMIADPEMTLKELMSVL